MASISPDERFLVNSDERCYSFTDTTFIKRERPLDERPINKRTGEPVVIPWLPERFQNEATVLGIIANNTKIPVPRVKGVGRDSNGRWYLVTELVQNAVRADMVDDRCWMQPDHGVYEGSCTACIDIAQTNTDQFITGTVLLWLSTLRFNSTAIKGFMVPPLWVLRYDKRPTWVPKTSTSDNSVMVHGDLGPHNIMLDQKTLWPVAVIDWEYACPLPPAFQRWSATRKGWFSLYDDEQLVRGLIAELS